MQLPKKCFSSRLTRTQNKTGAKESGKLTVLSVAIVKTQITRTRDLEKISASAASSGSSVGVVAARAAPELIGSQARRCAGSRLRFSRGHVRMALRKRISSSPGPDQPLAVIVRTSAGFLDDAALSRDRESAILESHRHT